MNLIMTPHCVYIYMIIYDHIYMYNMENLIMSSFYNIYIYIYLVGGLEHFLFFHSVENNNPS